MTDIVVTVPEKKWQEWLAEGDLPGDSWSRLFYHFDLSRCPSDTRIGDRCYVVARGAVRGYSPIVGVHRVPGGGCQVVRGGGAVAVTPVELETDGPMVVKGFQGFRYVWWDRSVEKKFPEWKTYGF